jgi:hypothetical protein
MNRLNIKIAQLEKDRAKLLKENRKLNQNKHQRTISYDDTRDVAIRCVDELIDLKIISENDHNFEIQDLIQDQINKVLDLDIDNKFKINII